MCTIYPVPKEYPKEIIGYAEPWIANPGDTVDIKVSCTEPEFKYRTLRFLQTAYKSRDGLPPQVEEIVSAGTGTSKGRFQLAHAGSYGVVENIGFKSDDTGIKLVFYAQPWMQECSHVQTLISTLDVSRNTGFAVVLSEKGFVDLWIGIGSEVCVVNSGFKPAKTRWMKIDLEIEGVAMRLDIKPLSRLMEPAAKAILTRATLKSKFAPCSSRTTKLLVAASQAASPMAKSQHHVPLNKFNGRLDTVILEVMGPNPRLLAQYDFSVEISSDSIHDMSGNRRNGTLVNAPSRAMTGYNWDGSETDWTKAQYGYGAIHFHDDDLDDAAWETDFSVRIPEDARSGVYGVEIKSTDSDVSDTVVFYVRPTETTTAELGAKAVFVLSTFTYLAYANEKMFRPDSPARAEVPQEFGSFEFYKDETFYKQDRREDLGRSVYDVHNDHSGVLFSSYKRPLLNNRPDYVNWTGHRPRELSAELIGIGFLELLGIPYDVLTDHDLHMKGVAALKPYTVALTGCHPEYPSLRSYQAYEDFLKLGGNLMYLGGNGFYWRSDTDLARPHRMEVRRGGQGVRTSWQQPGERIHSMTGVVGGLWRDCGKAANFMVGIGCCGEGTGAGVPYRIAPNLEQTHPQIKSWVFNDLVEPNDNSEFLFGRNTLGGFGGGASADEIDRVDFHYGSPSNIVVLASSTGHPDTFGLFPEDSNFPMLKTLGTQTDMIRSDMTYYETSGGGGVFSVGSISWYLALGWRNYDNDVAIITSNVLKQFIKGPSSLLGNG